MQLIDLSRIKVSCENCNLAELCLPRGLEMNDLERLDRVARRSRPIHKGDSLFRHDERMGSLYAVRSGSIKVFAEDPAGGEQILGFYFPGELLGLDASSVGLVNSCCSNGRTKLYTGSKKLHMVGAVDFPGETISACNVPLRTTSITIPSSPNSGSTAVISPSGINTPGKTGGMLDSLGLPMILT